MRRKTHSKGKSHKGTKVGILFGIPLLLLICGITLISIGSYNYLRYAFFLSRIFIQDEFKPAAQSTMAVEDRKIKFPKFGEEFGELIIESASIDYPVINGDLEEQLLKGIGHFFGSRYPGESGNIVLAGHRNSVFKNLKKVSKGDKVIFSTTWGKYVYKVNDIKIIKGTDYSIAQPSDTEKLTIYTCYPFEYIGNAPQRYVLTCELVEGTPMKELLLKEGGK